jgi:hypothetical protein
MIIKKQEAMGIVKKFEMVIRPGKEIIAKFCYNDTFPIYTRIPKGKGDMQCTGKFRAQLHLNEEQLKEAIRCPFKKEHFINNLREKGYIK